MKHLIFSLLCVSVCLSGMASTPRDMGIASAKMKNIKSELSAKKIEPSNLRRINLPEFRMLSGSFLQPRQFSSQERISLENIYANNGACANRAPRRLSNDDIAANSYLDFRYVWKMSDESADLEWSDYHFRGMEGVYWTNYDDQLYCAGLYWNELNGSTTYLPVDIDYNTGDVTLYTGMILEDDTIEGTFSAHTRSKVDTINYTFIVDADWFNGASDDFSPIPGRLYDDGSIEFSNDEAYVVSGYRVLNSYSRSGNATIGYRYNLTSSDTTYFADFYMGTQLIVPNALHSYDIDNGTGTQHVLDDAFMYQPDASTVVVFNLCGLGMPGVTLHLNSDGTMQFPLMDYPIGEISPGERDYYANFYGQEYTWDDTRWFWPIALDENYEMTAATEIIGNVDSESLTWGAMEFYLPGIIRVSDGANVAIVSYPMINNMLAFTDGSQFVLPVNILPGDANNDGVVTIDDIDTLVERLAVANLDDADDFNGDNADVNQDGSIDLNDITDLIDLLINAQ